MDNTHLIRSELEKLRTKEGLSPKEVEYFNEAIRIFTPTTDEERKKEGIRVINVVNGDGTKLQIFEGGRGIRVKVRVETISEKSQDQENAE